METGSGNHTLLPEEEEEEEEGEERKRRCWWLILDSIPVSRPSFLPPSLFLDQGSKSEQDRPRRRRLLRGPSSDVDSSSTFRPYVVVVLELSAG